MPKNKCSRCDHYPCICISWCPSRQIGCCNHENSSMNCAGPVHLTHQFDIGSRPCCKGGGEKYSSMGGLFNYCSVNKGKEFPKGKRVLAPSPMGNYADVELPRNNPRPVKHPRDVILPMYPSLFKDCGECYDNGRVTRKGMEGIY